MPAIPTTKSKNKLQLTPEGSQRLESKIPLPAHLEASGVFRDKQSRKGQSDASAHWQRLRSYDRHAHKWLEGADVIKLDVDIEVLRAQVKNGADGRKMAEEYAFKNDNEGSEVDALSCRVVDCNGKMILAYFGHRLSETKSEFKGHPRYCGRTEDAIEVAKCLEAFCAFDGLMAQMVNDLHRGSQALCHTLPPRAANRDVRHNANEKTLAYEVQCAPLTEGSTDQEIIMFERCGVIHLAVWEMQGHRGKGLLPSRDLTHGSLASLGVKKYYQLSGQAVQYLAACFKVAFPEYYKKYEVAFAVGQWSKSDPGPWIGQVIVWKLQVHAHEDGLDDGPTCAFPLGSFTGGRLYLPDLDLRFSYRPGDFVIFLSGDLYHVVSKWEPKGTLGADGLTPGRIGHVLFFTQVSYEVLKDKPEGWLANTMGRHVIET